MLTASLALSLRRPRLPGAGGDSTLSPTLIGSNLTLSAGNRRVTHNATAAWNSVLGTLGRSTGKWYFEVVNEASGGSGYEMFGIARNTIDLNAAAGLDTADAWAQQSNGFRHFNTATGGYGNTWTVGDVVSVAYDADTGALDFYKNGVNMGATGVLGLTGTFYPALALYSNSSLTLRVTAAAFSHTPPSGYSAWG